MEKVQPSICYPIVKFWAPKILTIPKEYKRRWSP